MNLTDLHKEAAYAALSEKQKTYVDARCGGTEKVQAAKVAWTCKDDRSARAQANQAEKHSKIKWLLEQFYGKKHIPDRDEMAGQLWEWATGSKDDKARAQFSKLTLDILGYAVKPAENKPTETVPNDGSDEFQL